MMQTIILSLLLPYKVPLGQGKDLIYGVCSRFGAFGDVGHIVQQSLLNLYLIFQTVVLMNDLLLQLLKLNQLRQHVFILRNFLLQLLVASIRLNHQLIPILEGVSGSTCLFFKFTIVLVEEIDLFFVHLQSIHQRLSLQLKCIHQCIIFMVYHTTIGHLSLKNTILDPISHACVVFVPFRRYRTQRSFIVPVIEFDKTLRIDISDVFERQLSGGMFVRSWALFAREQRNILDEVFLIHFMPVNV